MFTLRLSASCGPKFATEPLKAAITSFITLWIMINFKIGLDTLRTCSNFLSNFVKCYKACKSVQFWQPDELELLSILFSFRFSVIELNYVLS